MLFLGAVAAALLVAAGAIAIRYGVVALEQQAHGRTADIDRKLTYRAMADDTAQALGSLGVSDADVLGYSSGANVALQLAISHPERVNRVAALAPFYTREGYRPGVLENLAQATPAAMPAIVRETYERVSPNANGWERLVSRVAEQAEEFEDWPREDLRSIQAPTLVVIGDEDIVRPEHALEISRLIPTSQCAVLPGTSHNMVIERPAWILRLLSDFMEDGA